MADAWKGRFEMLAAAAGTAALIEFIGMGVMFSRFHQAGIPAAESAAAMPKTSLFVIGATTILPFVGVAVLSVLVLYASAKPKPAAAVQGGQPPGAGAGAGPGAGAAVGPGAAAPAAPGTPGAPAPAGQGIDLRSPQGVAPDGTKRALGVLAVGTLVLVVLFERSGTALTAGDIWKLVLALILAGALARAIMIRGSSLSAAAWGLFVGLLLMGVALTAVREHATEARFDMAALQRSDGGRVSGFFIARTDQAVYLIVRNATREEAGGEGFKQRCLAYDETGIEENEARRRECARKLRVAVVPSGSVASLVYGPRGEPVSAVGFRRAERLERLLDETPPKLEPPPQAAPDQSLREGVTVTVQCDERCSPHVKATAVGTRSRTKIKMEAVRRTRVRPVAARFLLRPKKGQPRLLDRTARVHVTIVAGDQARNRTSYVLSVRAKP